MAWRRGQAYSEDLATRIVAAVDGGVPVYEAAAIFGVSVSYIYKALQRRRATGSIGPRPRLGRPGTKLGGHTDDLRLKVEGEPDITIVELIEWCEVNFDISMSVGGMWNALDCLGLTYKKNRTRGRARAA